jgi:hypothetical protein
MFVDYSGDMAPVLDPGTRETANRCSEDGQ